MYCVLILKKTFDRVPHRKLLRKLKRYNLHPDLIDWIKAFLCDRKQVALMHFNYNITDGSLTYDGTSVSSTKIEKGLISILEVYH